MKLIIAAVGKLKDRALRDLTDDYLKRINRHLPIQVKEFRSADRLVNAAPDNWERVALDERGRELTSRQFAVELQQRMTRSVPGVVFFLGGAEGLTDEVRAAAHWTLSLSKMTLPHRLTRVLFAEQLYRALTIIKGEPYHR